MTRDVEEKYAYTHTNVPILCTLRRFAEGMCVGWLGGWGGRLTMRKYSTLLVDTQEPLRYHLCLIFFCHTTGIYSNDFGAEIRAICSRAAKTYLNTIMTCL